MILEDKYSNNYLHTRQVERFRVRILKHSIHFQRSTEFNIYFLRHLCDVCVDLMELPKKLPVPANTGEDLHYSYLKRAETEGECLGLYGTDTA